MVERLQPALDSTLGALADPTRRAILARLALGETSATNLAQPFRMSLPAVAKHLRVLDVSNNTVPQLTGSTAGTQPPPCGTGRWNILI